MKTFNEQNEAFSAAFGLAFVFIFMVLASQFESLKHPFTIMVSLPLALIGARARPPAGRQEPVGWEP